MTISAVLACRNEEPFIGAWLEEAAAYAGEILIAVHAPTDATADIIARFKAHSPVPIRCEWFPAPTTWRFGFSLMKNEMIARAAGDWITSIDADEEIGLAPDGLRAALEATMAEGRSVLSLVPAEHPSPRDVADDWGMDRRATLRTAHRPVAPSYRKYRIFRNRAGFWWRGLVHEQLARHGHHAREFSRDGDAFLHHYGYLRRPEPEWKVPLYSSLICRVRDCPHLKPAGASPGYLRRFEADEAGLRAEAARFAAHRDAWFPEVPRREP